MTLQVEVTIGLESAHGTGVDALLRHSDELSAALYPPEHRYPANADALSGPAARLLVARAWASSGWLAPAGSDPPAQAGRSRGTPSASGPPHTVCRTEPGRGAALGCVGLLLHEGYGELKRLIVAPEARGLGIGRALMGAVEATARREGLSVLRLETGPGNVHALALYREAGWTSCDPFGDYRPNPFSLFLERRLPATAAAGSLA